MHHYTPEDLIRYLYKETSAEETAAIEQALQSDWTLREKMSVLKTSNERLNTLIETPRTEVVLNVLKYAASKQKVTS
jgi:anti-sigma factor RsiW